MTTQLAVRIPDQLARGLDWLVDSGRYANRTDAVRGAIAELVERERRVSTGREIVDGYRAIPETDEEMAVAEANLRRLVAEEPW